MRLVHLSMAAVIGLTSVHAIASVVSSPGPGPAGEILDPDALDEAGDGRLGTDPCHDFYRFACGRWLELTPIPADRDSISRQVTPLTDRADETLNGILAAYVRGERQPPSSAAGQLGDYYATCMEAPKKGPAALAALGEKLAALRQLPTGRADPAFARAVARLHLESVGALFAFGSGQDFADSRRVIGYVAQGGMGLPQPDYYSRRDAKSKETRRRYVAHVAKVLRLSGWSAGAAAATRDARAVMRIESSLAERAYPLEDQDNPARINHPFTVEGLRRASPAFDWDAYFAELAAAVPNAPPIAARLNVSEPEFLARVSELLVRTPAADLRAYLASRVATRAIRTAYVAPALDAEQFAFWHAFMHGEKEPKPRWKQCAQSAQDRLGYALAEAYVTTVDAGAVRAKVSAMIEWIRQAFRDDLGRLGWMDAPTAKAALEKLELLGQKLGAPDKWRDYSTLKTDRATFLGNERRASAFEERRDLAKIGKPVDRSEWDIMPWEVNAYYDQAKNEFVFPFGILQPPSFDLRASDGANLGAFGGGTIGHELTHGYDNEGRQYDGRGNVREWWSPATLKQFEARSACFVEQADAYRIAEVGLPVRGKATLPENLADQGGVKLGYLALQSQLAHRSPSPAWHGRYNENQQFWIAYAQGWCTKRTPEGLRTLLATDSHPPEEFRVNGVVMNRPEFARDFACRPGSRMAPAKRCEMW